MPPKVKVTKEDIINATVDIVRNSGAQAINARKMCIRDRHIHSRRFSQNIPYLHP